jgi:hypothetical protein
VTVTSSDLSKSYIVGGTRTTGAPTSTVLVVKADGTLSWASFSVPRLGATAAWVDPIGLVIEGGNVGTDAGAPPGAEYLVNDATGEALGYPADPTTGSAMTVLGAPGATSSNVLVVSGAGARVIAVPCGGSNPACAPTPWQATLPTPLALAQVFDLDASNVFVVGEDASGAMHAYTLSATTVVEIPFRLPRSHARAVRLPIGTAGAGPIAVVGGDQAGGTMESFVPQGRSSP